MWVCAGVTLQDHHHLLASDLKQVLVPENLIISITNYTPLEYGVSTNTGLTPDFRYVRTQFEFFTIWQQSWVQEAAFATQPLSKAVYWFLAKLHNVAHGPVPDFYP